MLLKDDVAVASSNLATAASSSDPQVLRLFFTDKADSVDGCTEYELIYRINSLRTNSDSLNGDFTQFVEIYTENDNPTHAFPSDCGEDS